jgi:hypothetical protein
MPCVPMLNAACIRWRNSVGDTLRDWEDAEPAGVVQAGDDRRAAWERDPTRGKQTVVSEK